MKFCDKNIKSFEMLMEGISFEVKINKSLEARVCMSFGTLFPFRCILRFVRIPLIDNKAACNPLSIQPLKYQAHVLCL